MSDNAKLTKTQVVSELEREPILLAYHDEEFRNQLKEALHAQDLKSKTAKNVWEVFEALIDYSFDLFVTDSDLPGTTCSELIKYCCKRHPAMQIIVLANTPSIREAVEVTRIGVFNYLEMPVTSEAIVTQVKLALAESKNRLIRNLVPSLDLNKKIFKFLPDLDVIKQLGTGSTGIVFQVKKNNANYALKIMRSDLAPEMYQLQRGGQFLSEAEILSSIKHPNIVRIYDYGFSNNYMPYILMEFIKGDPLTNIIKDKSLSIKDRIKIFAQICKAIGFIHKNKVLHRDIKPGNIMVADDLTVKLTDFGLAHIIDLHNSSTENQIVGSPAYMSPEAFDKNFTVDHHSDIFSLGVLGYELFTGEKPFFGNNVHEIRHAICNARPVAPRKINSDIHTEIENILNDMLAKKPKDRFSNLGEIVNSIESLLHHSSSSPHQSKRRGLLGLFGSQSNWA
ncbi:MAG: protein kinase [Victivallales bacterium]|nr:protein kinase [Victivallales bacterium]